MANPRFVEIYNPNLTGNPRALVSLTSLDDHVSRGWLLVDGVTPAPSSPFLTPAIADQRYLRTEDVDDPQSTGGAALRAASVAAVAGADIDFTGTVDFAGATVTGLTTGGTDNSYDGGMVA